MICAQQGCRNSFKYKCEDCGTEMMIKQFQLMRRSSIKCVGCGSMRLGRTHDGAIKRSAAMGEAEAMRKAAVYSACNTSVYCPG